VKAALTERDRWYLAFAPLAAAVAIGWLWAWPAWVEWGELRERRASLGEMEELEMRISAARAAADRAEGERAAAAERLREAEEAMSAELPPEADAAAAGTAGERWSRFSAAAAGCGLRVLEMSPGEETAEEGRPAGLAGDAGRWAVRFSGTWPQTRRFLEELAVQPTLVVGERVEMAGDEAGSDGVREWKMVAWL
jgi:hypothetical protein